MGKLRPTPKADELAKPTTKRAPLAVWITVLVLPAIVYLPTLWGGFLDSWDDRIYLTENPVVLGGLRGSAIVWAFSGFHEANYHPLTWLSLLLDVSIWGKQPFGFHLTNLLLHVANVGLVFWIGQKLIGDSSRAAVMALLFGLHPLHVESVAWITERKDVLSGLFGWLALASYLKYRQHGFWETTASLGKTTAWGWYALLLVSQTLSLLAKGTFVTLPCLLLILDWLAWPPAAVESKAPLFSRGPLKTRLLEKLPLFALSAVASWVTVLAQQAGGAVSSLAAHPWEGRLANAIQAYGRYLAHLLWPANLTFFYPYNPCSLTSLATGTTAAILLLLTLLAWRGRQAKPLVLAGWLWYLGMMVPMIGLIQVGAQAMADRYTYAPAVGLYLALAALLPPWASLSRAGQTAFLAGLAALVLWLSGWTYRQLSFWRNDETLLNRQMTVFPEDGRGYLMAGAYYTKQRDSARALPFLRCGLDLEPDSHQGHFNLGLLAFRQQRWDEAIAAFQQAVRLNPQGEDYRLNLAVAYVRVARFDEAIAEYHHLLETRPKGVNLWFNLALAYRKSGRLAEARRCYQRVVQLDPTHEDARINLAVLERLAAEQKQN